jgi:glycosyltransferase involved in cell wall biosynthesis
LEDVEFHIVGGYPEDIEKWQQLIRNDNVTFHGFMPHFRVSEVLAEFDIVIAPYQNDIHTNHGKANISRWMSPLKIFEYMAHAKAIVASDLEVIHEVLTHRANALLVPCDDVLAWRNAIRELMDEPDLRKALGQRANQDFRENYSWETRAGTVLADIA